jgi:hypothetical protein
MQDNSEWEQAIIYNTNTDRSTAINYSLVIANNTFDGPNKNADGPVLFSVQKPGYILFHDTGAGHDTVIVQNNIFSGGTAGCYNIYKNAAWAAGGSTFTIKDGVYDDATICDWNWNGGADITSLAAWNTASGETSSVECDPTYVSIATGDAHITSGDTCAQDAGSDASAYTTVDYDKQDRPYNATWDIGADEWMPVGGLVGGGLGGGAGLQ